ncbi:hypothetical protein [Streptomyces triculaminicus]|uniref:hypothetical protein n=1 Tax=Streptomyces triculaminicus TaxID=2816232 RepID=UPI0037B26FDC
MAVPLPSSVLILDPVIRNGRYLAVAEGTPGRLIPLWHVWDADGAYAGYATAAELIPLVIARHERADDQ